MIKVSVLYPWTPGASFDMDYYCDKHMALVRRLLGKTLKGVAVDAGLSGDSKGTKPPYVAIGHLLFDSLDDVRKVFAVHGETLMADVANYTAIEPVFQISEVKL